MPRILENRITERIDLSILRELLLLIILLINPRVGRIFITSEIKYKI